MSKESLFDTRMLQMSFSIPADTLSRLKIASKSQHISVSALVRPWLEQGLNKEYPEVSDTENDENLGDA